MASNYNIARLIIGQFLSVGSTIMAIFAIYQNTAKLSTSAIPFTLITAAYGVMMFASSYVEEEQHFWYYTTTAWLAYVSWRGFSGYVSFTPDKENAPTLTISTGTQSRKLATYQPSSSLP